MNEGEGDRAAILAISRSALPGHWTDEQLLAELEREGTAAVIDPSRSGFAIASRVMGEAELLLIGVDPAARRKGIGRRVLDALHAALAAAGVERIFAEVRASNAPAIALYLDRGYREVGIRRAYYRDGEDARILACDL